MFVLAYCFALRLTFHLYSTKSYHSKQEGGGGETEKQIDRKTEKQIDRETDKHREREREMEGEKVKREKKNLRV